MVPVLEMLPCPFCGSEIANIIDRGEHPGVVFIKCNDCEAEGPPTGWGYLGGYQTRQLAHEKAIELWNTRAVMHVKFTESNVAYTTINDQVFVPLTPRVQRLA